ncbi:hypothetical protein GN956_G24154 [Arapaima gigas]
MACWISAKALWSVLIICSLLPEGDQAPSFGVSQRSSLDAEPDHRRDALLHSKSPSASFLPSQDSASGLHYEGRRCLEHQQLSWFGGSTTAVIEVHWGSSGSWSRMMACGIHSRVLWSVLLVWSLLPEGEQVPVSGVSRRSTLDAEPDRRRQALLDRKSPLADFTSSQDTGRFMHSDGRTQTSVSYPRNVSSSHGLFSGRPVFSESLSPFFPGLGNNPANVGPTHNPSSSMVSSGAASGSGLPHTVDSHSGFPTAWRGSYPAGPSSVSQVNPVPLDPFGYGRDVLPDGQAAQRSHNAVGSGLTGFPQGLYPSAQGFGPYDAFPSSQMTLPQGYAIPGQSVLSQSVSSAAQTLGGQTGSQYPHASFALAQIPPVAGAVPPQAGGSQKPESPNLVSLLVGANGGLWATLLVKIWVMVPNQPQALQVVLFLSSLLATKWLLILAIRSLAQRPGSNREGPQMRSFTQKRDDESAACASDVAASLVHIPPAAANTHAIADNDIPGGSREAGGRGRVRSARRLVTRIWTVEENWSTQASAQSSARIRLSEQWAPGGRELRIQPNVVQGTTAGRLPGLKPAALVVSLPSPGPRRTEPAWAAGRSDESAILFLFPFWPQFSCTALPAKPQDIP